MVELVDTQDLKSCDLKSRAGSIPALSTKQDTIRFFKRVAPNGQPFLIFSIS
jgi:hypothetical protein